MQVSVTDHIPGVRDREKSRRDGNDTREICLGS